MSDTVPTRRCRRHGAALAGWRCQDCEALLCPDCAVRTPVGAASFFDACALCGGPVDVLTRPAPVASFRQLLLSLIRSPVERTALWLYPLLLSWGLLCAWSQGAPGRLIWLSGPLAVALALVHSASVARNARAPDAGDVPLTLELWRGLLLPGAPLAVALAGWFSSPRWSVFANVQVAFTSPLAWVMALLVCVGVPFVSLALHARVGLIGLWEAARRPPTPLPLALAACVALAFTLHALFWSAAALNRAALSGQGVLLCAGYGLLWLVHGQIVGMLLHVLAPRVGLELSPRYRAPVLETPPRGKRGVG